MNIQKICLVCMDRTGSNMIASRLNTHPEICFYNELFHREWVIFQDERVNGNHNFVAQRDQHPSVFVSRIWNAEFEPKEVRSKISSVGFKLFINHNAAALKYVINSDAKIIFLRRRNPLARFSSFKIASKSGVWKSKEEKKETRISVQFFPTEFRAYYENYRSLETLMEMTLARWSRPYFSVWYEDFIRDPSIWKDLTAYLGYRAEDFSQAPLRKQNSSNILSRFSNPETVEEFVKRLGNPDWLRES